MIIFRSSGLLAGLLLLQGCGDRIGHEDLICDPSPGVIGGPGSNFSEQAAFVEQCIHKWGYRFAGAPGGNREIADAVIGRCRESLNRLSQFASRGAQDSGDAQPAAAKLEVDYREMALRRVVEARAGHCDIRGDDQK